jgi:hypothetical protein
MKEGKPFEGDHESIASLRKGHYLCDVVVVVGVAVKEKKIKNKKMMISIFIC